MEVKALERYFDLCFFFLSLFFNMTLKLHTDQLGSCTIHIVLLCWILVPNDMKIKYRKWNYSQVFQNSLC